MKPWSIFAIVQPGLEVIAQEELETEFNIKSEIEFGGLNYTTHPRKLFQTIPYLKIPSRFLIRLNEFHARHFRAFINGIKDIDYSAFITDQPVDFKIECHHCALYHSGALEERFRSQLDEKRTIDPTKPTTTIYVRGQDNLFTISLDASGEHHHKRGLLKLRGEAPLRETIAAAMVRTTAPEGNILDPFCGSGTLMLESHLYRHKTSIKNFRSFTYESWPIYQQDPEASKDLELTASSHHAPQYFGSDLDEKTLQACRENLSHFEKSMPLNLMHEDFKNLSLKDLPLEKGHILTNPPYGERLPFQSLYKQCMEWKSIYPEMTITTLLPKNKAFRDAKMLFSIRNGGIPVVAQQI